LKGARKSSSKYLGVVEKASFPPTAKSTQPLDLRFAKKNRSHIWLDTKLACSECSHFVMSPRTASDEGWFVFHA